MATNVIVALNKCLEYDGQGKVRLRAIRSGAGSAANYNVMGKLRKAITAAFRVRVSS